MNGDSPTSLSPDQQMQVGECSCKSCRSACQHRPGFFRPEQIAPLARAMGISTKRLFKEHLQVDWWTGDPDTFLLAPRLDDEKGGRMYPPDPRGACHWYKDGKCAIHALGKPAECQGLGHKNGETVTADREEIVEAWKGEQQMVRDLYGSELIAPETSIFDMIGMLGDLR